MGPTSPLPQWPLLPLSMPYAEEAQRARATMPNDVKAGEPAFRTWFDEMATHTGIDKNPDDPRHQYDYRAAFKANVFPQMDPSDLRYHWPSQFKAPGHPNRFVEGIDTITGQPGAPRRSRFIPVSEVLRERQSSLNPPGQSGVSAAPSFLSRMTPSNAAWQAAFETVPLPAAIRGVPGGLARSLPSQKGQMNLKKAIQALGARVMSPDEYRGATAGTRSTAGIGLGRARSQIVPVEQRIVGPDGQRLEDPAYLYEYAKEWYRAAAMRAHPDRGGTEKAMKAVNDAFTFIEKHSEEGAAARAASIRAAAELQRAINPRFFQR